MTQRGLYHTVIGSSLESCCTFYCMCAQLKPGQAIVLLVLALLLQALQNSLICRGEWFWEKQLSQNRAQQITTHASTLNRGIVRGAQCSVWLPEVDRVVIKGLWEAEVTCWNYSWESNACGDGRRNKKIQAAFSLSLCVHPADYLKAHWNCSTMTHVLEYTVILNYWTVVSGCGQA